MYINTSRMYIHIYVYYVNAHLYQWYNIVEQEHTRHNPATHRNTVSRTNTSTPAHAKRERERERERTRESERERDVEREGGRDGERERERRERQREEERERERETEREKEIKKMSLYHLDRTPQHTATPSLAPHSIKSRLHSFSSASCSGIRLRLREAWSESKVVESTALDTPCFKIIT